MTKIRNNAEGPRVFNLKSKTEGVVPQRILAPGEIADLDLLLPLADDPVTAAWLKAGDIEEGGEPEAAVDMAKLAEVQARAAEATAEAAAMGEARQAIEMDTARRTPPRQFGSDGGPAQVPTVDGTGGDLTPAQQEEGRQEKPAAPARAAEAKPAAKK